MASEKALEVHNLRNKTFAFPGQNQLMTLSHESIAKPVGSFLTEPLKERTLPYTKILARTCVVLMQHVYGKEAAKRGPNEWDARACVEGEYSWVEQQPDSDLGKSITPGFRNAVAEGRAFGIPSIRSDIEPYAQRSVADTQNYGDDSSARQVVGIWVPPFPRPLSGRRVEFTALQ